MRNVRVRQGWSGEVAPNTWAKADIELEEDDLRRLLIAEGVLPSQYDLRLILPPIDAYRLLEIEAEILLSLKLITRYGMDGAAKLEQLRQAKAKIISQVKVSGQ